MGSSLRGSGLQLVVSRGDCESASLANTRLRASISQSSPAPEVHGNPALGRGDAV